MDKPNILLICVDHWPGRLLGADNHPCVMTPTLDQLCANGIRFTNTYSTTPTCIPARRALMTGTTSRTHGDRIFNQKLPMPDLPSLAGTFSDAGYQTYAVGKLHVYPQRDRIGFNDALINEEGRHHLGLKADDYELFLAQEGYTGQEQAHGMGVNEYITRPWHLPERLHPTNWTAYETCRAIKRRDPTRPAFWYASFNHPHPPMTPLKVYWDLYSDAEIPKPFYGDWAENFDELPYALKVRFDQLPGYAESDIKNTRRAFYAICTHIDHQLRLIIGCLREEGLLDNTVIAFISDHGDMLGNHGLYKKALFYDDAAKVPFIIVPTSDYKHFGHHMTDDRLVALRDVMPTLLEMSGIRIPDNVEGISLLSDTKRKYLYGEHYDSTHGRKERATRMLLGRRYKLIYYPVGNRIQLFDLLKDPDEGHNLAGDAGYSEIISELSEELTANLWGDDLDWIKNSRLTGTPDVDYEPSPNRGLNSQRGWRFM